MNLQSHGFYSEDLHNGVDFETKQFRFNEPHLNNVSFTMM